MRVDPLLTRLTLGLLALAAFVGCTRSLEMNYSPALYRLPQAKPEDRRASVVQSDPTTSPT